MAAVFNNNYPNNNFQYHSLEKNKVLETEIKPKKKKPRQPRQPKKEYTLPASGYRNIRKQPRSYSLVINHLVFYGNVNLKYCLYAKYYCYKKYKLGINDIKCPKLSKIKKKVIENRVTYFYNKHKESGKL